MSLNIDIDVPNSESATSVSPSPRPAKQAISWGPSTSAKKPVYSHPIGQTAAAAQIPSSTVVSAQDGDESPWGSNFWVTLIDPQTQVSFFACPATGQVSWDAPVGNFVLPPSEEGEWWELSDESRGGLPYYYQTKTGETVWERPPGFVIPLGIIQNTALGRRLSQIDRFSNFIPKETVEGLRATSKSRSKDQQHLQNDARRSPGKAPGKSVMRKSGNSEHLSNGAGRLVVPSQLTPIPGSPYVSEHSLSSPPSPQHSVASIPIMSALPIENPPERNENDFSNRENKTPRSASGPPSYALKHPSARPPQPQSLQAAVRILASSHSDSGHDLIQSPTTSISGSSLDHGKLTIDVLSDGSTTNKKRSIPPSPQRPIPSIPSNRRIATPTIGGKQISGPILNHAATAQMSPVKNRSTGKPILVELSPFESKQATSIASIRNSIYPSLPHALATDIQQFSESEYAKQYFSTHRSGFILRRKVPVEQLMTWQKAPLNSPLLLLNRMLHKEAVKCFKVIQHIMGDREREKPVGVRLQPDSHISMVASINASSTSLNGSHTSMLEEERWLLAEGLTHGELRDEIYCQLMKQLTGNPNTESIFKGWQILCVLLITFPPSKNFETYLQSFIQKYTGHAEGRVDIMAKYCLRRLVSISRKGPRGKPPTISEIETAADAAFNPSTFGESLDAIIRLQERNYAHQMVPIILPFLADGILALGGPKSEGIFRVPGDNDSVSELKLRIDRGYYTLDGVDDPHVLASLLKLWLRELCDPLIPDEMYNECISNSTDEAACIGIVERLPTINRRVVLFVVSFLQLFLDEKTQNVTKMTPANLALVMAPNILRCNSESMSVVFTNAQYEQIFVYNLLLHLRCDEIDGTYKPVHGLAAVSSIAPSKMTKTRSRRPN